MSAMMAPTSNVTKAQRHNEMNTDSVRTMPMAMGWMHAHGTVEH